MKPLLDIAPPAPEFSRDVLAAPGGFVWWYTDMLDEDLNGIVLIWSFGLPFLPGYASAARRGAPQTPADRPSVNVAIMRRGRLACYLLHEVAPHDAHWDGSTWRLGSNDFRSHALDGVRTLDVALDCPLPGGERLHGTVTLSGVARQPHPEDRTSHVHDWSPFAGPATTSVDVTAAGERYAFTGPGYFDGNTGSGPLHDAGFSAWSWGRVARADRQLIYYLLWADDSPSPSAVGIEIDATGHMTRLDLDVTLRRRRRGRAGLRFPSDFDLHHDDTLWAHVRTAAVLDDGPFYLRYIVQTTHGHGLGEYCRVDRIDLARHRPLVQMRVQRAAGGNSMWLPLFTGPRAGRIARLLSQFVEP